jgi:hypothetical protein
MSNLLLTMLVQSQRLNLGRWNGNWIMCFQTFGLHNYLGLRWWWAPLTRCPWLHVKFAFLLGWEKKKVICPQVAHWKRKKKSANFDRFLEVLQQGHFTIDYENMWQLFILIQVPKNPWYYWNDLSAWNMAKYMHHILLTNTHLEID